MDPGPVTIFLVDDDESVRRAIGKLLRAASQVVAAFSSASELLAALDPLDAERPGCIVLELRLPQMNGLDLQAALRRAGCVLPIVFISGHGDVPTTARAMKGGAVDFLAKPIDEDELLLAIGTALQRDARARAERAEVDDARRRLAALTPREREVCERVAVGWLNKEIAHELGTMEKTVKVQRARAMEKLGVDSVPALVRLLDLARRPPSSRSRF